VTIFGPDISDRQAGLSLASVKQNGYRFVTARALSYPKGIPEPDPSYATFRDEAHRLGLGFAAYVLLHTAATAAEQAQQLARVIGDPGIPVMVDFEPDGDTPTLALCEQFYDAASSEGLIVRSLYDPHWWWTQTGMPPLTSRPWRLVSSNYGSNAPGSAAGRYATEGGDTGPGWNPYGGLTPQLWQFGSDIVLGTGTMGATVYGDANAWRGTADELALSGLFTFWNGAHMTNVGLDPADPAVAQLLTASAPYDPTHASQASVATLLHVLLGIRDGAPGFDSLPLLLATMKSLALQVNAVQTTVGQIETQVATLAAAAGTPTPWHGTISVTPGP